MIPDTFVQEFESFKSQLKSFLLRMTVSVQDCEDILQETYIKAHRNLNTFRGEASLKTWVFAIASNLARDLLRAQKRWPENVTDICKEAALDNQAFFQEAVQIRMTSPKVTLKLKSTLHFALPVFPKRSQLSNS